MRPHWIGVVLPTGSVDRQYAAHFRVATAPIRARLRARRNVHPGLQLNMSLARNLRGCRRPTERSAVPGGGRQPSPAMRAVAVSPICRGSHGGIFCSVRGELVGGVALQGEERFKPGMLDQRIGPFGEARLGPERDPEAGKLDHRKIVGAVAHRKRI